MNTSMVQNVAAPAPTNTASEQLSLLELFHTLIFRRRLLFSTAFFIIAVGIIMLYQLEPRYSATSAMVGVPKSNVVAIEEVLSTGLGNDNETEVEILRSRELARKVIEKFNLRSKKEFNPGLRSPGLLSYINPGRLIPDWLKEMLGLEPDTMPSEEEIARREMLKATDIFLGKLKISTVGSSRIINISFESTNPVMAATIANELPEIYIIGRMEAKLDATEKATRWLNEKLTDLKETVEKSEKAVELYRSSHNLMEVQGDRILSSHLSEVNQQLILAKAERAQSELRMQQIRKLQSQGGSGIESAKEVMSSILIQKLREQETLLTRKASELSVQYGPKHNKMKQVNAEIKDIREKIDLEIQRIVVAQENELEVAQRRVESLSKSLKELENQSGEQTTEMISLHALEREASANRTLFERFLIRFKETTSTTGMLEADARVISQAEIPLAASFPNKRMLLVLIIAGGFIAAIILVFIVQALNQGLLTPEQIEKELGLATIGMIPLIQSKKVHDYILDKPQSSYAEALNTLKTSLILSNPDEEVKAMQFTSSIPQEGKSTLSIAFARLLAKAGNKVILVDSDLRRGSLHKKLGISAKAGSKGLTDLVMTSGGSFEEFIIKDKKSGAYIMLHGAAEFVNATDIFSSHRMHEIIDLLKKNFDYVIIDTPPVMAVSDARIIAKLVDKTVFVVQWDKTPRKVMKTAVQILKDDNADIAGCVLNQVDLQRYASFLSHGASGYYYQHARYGDYYTN